MFVVLFYTCTCITCTVCAKHRTGMTRWWEVPSQSLSLPSTFGADSSGWTRAMTELTAAEFARAHLWTSHDQSVHKAFRTLLVPSAHDPQNHRIMISQVSGDAVTAILESCLIPGSQLPVQTSELRREAATACNSGKKSKEDEKLWTRKGRVAKQYFFP